MLSSSQFSFSKIGNLYRKSEREKKRNLYFWLVGDDNDNDDETRYICYISFLRKEILAYIYQQSVLPLFNVLGIYVSKYFLLLRSRQQTQSFCWLMSTGFPGFNLKTNDLKCI